MPHDHATIPMVAGGEVVQVDTAIAPLIEWLNSLPGVLTHFCCEGSHDDLPKSSPYVLFSASEPESLTRILRELKTARSRLNPGDLDRQVPRMGDRRIELTVEEGHGSHRLSYYLRFTDPKARAVLVSQVAALNPKLKELAPEGDQ